MTRGTFIDLQTSVGTLSTYNLCVKHRLITVDPTFNNRWNTWLNYFDAHGGGNIRNQMASALRGHTAELSFLLFRQRVLTWQPLTSRTVKQERTLW